jgi:hypothetical protein
LDGGDAEVKEVLQAGLERQRTRNTIHQRHLNSSVAKSA